MRPTPTTAVDLTPAASGRWWRLLRTRDRTATVALVAILIGGTVLRCAGIAWGRPYVYHPDEGLVVKSALRMIDTGDWNPHMFFYSSLLIDLEAILVAILHALFGMPLATDQPWLFASEALPAQFKAFLAGRILVAGFGIATIVVVYEIARRLGGRGAALVAAAIIAFSPLHIQSSRYVTTDVPVTFWCALTLLAAIQATRTPGRDRWWVLSAAFVGLAASTKWNAVAIGVVPAVAFLLDGMSVRQLMSRLRSRVPYVMAATGAGVLILTTPAVVFATREVMDYFALQAVLYGTARTNLQPNNLIVQYQATTSGFIWLIQVLLLGGTAWLAVRRRPVEVGMAAFVVIYAAILSIPPTHFDRNVLPILPVAAAGFGLLVTSLVARLRGTLAERRRPFVGFAVHVAIATALVLSLVPTLAADAADARRLRRSDTRTVALEWILQHVPRAAIFAREQYTPQLSPESYRTRNQPFLYLRRLEWYRALRVNYLIVSSANYVRFLGNPATAWADEFYRDVFKLPEVYRIDPAGQRVGYTIRIFRLSPIADGP